MVDKIKLVSTTASNAARTGSKALGVGFRGKLIIASNRAPYFKNKNGRYEKSIGGLVSALDPVMSATRGVWVASTPGVSKGRGADDELEDLRVPPDNPKYIVHHVPVKGHDMNGYYHGYSNRLLWPLCHMLLDKVYLKEFYWQSYKKVNALFADAIIERAKKKGGFVWLQDYHLSLCAGYIRNLRPDLRLSIFWHIPWPPHDVFRATPHRKEILEGMLANDLVGFQIANFKRNFLRCVDLELGADIDVKGLFIHWKGHITKVKVFPISVDFRWFDAAARSRKAVRFSNKFKRDHGLTGRIIGISVDRLDYTKGIVKCFDALEIFFEKYPEYRGRFTFVQIAIPTRKTEPYLSYMMEVKQKVASINEMYGTKDWKPVEYIEKCCSHHELAALFRVADLMLITSVFDGMNLVAKEFVASQVDCSGTLLVSEFAGVVDGMPGVTAINPYDSEGCADMIKAGIEAPAQRKKEMMTIAREYLAKNDIYRWVEKIMDEMKGLRR